MYIEKRNTSNYNRDSNRIPSELMVKTLTPIPLDGLNQPPIFNKLIILTVNEKNEIKKKWILKYDSLCRWINFDALIQQL